MLAGLRGSVGAGTKEEESSTGRVWVAVSTRSLLARVLKLTNLIFLQFSIFFRAAVNRGYGGPPVHKFLVTNFLSFLTSSGLDLNTVLRISYSDNLKK
jgi:hypothetical protein